MAHFAKITPLGRSAFVVRLDSPPTWRVSEVGGWADASAGCYIPPSRRDWLSGALCEIGGPFGPMHMGTVRCYDGSTLTIEGQHASAMMGEPTLGRFCVTDLGAWQSSSRTDQHKDLTVGVAGIDGTSTTDALTVTWNPLTIYPANSWGGHVIDFGETVDDAYLSFDYKTPASTHVKVYPMVDGTVALGSLPFAASVAEAPASTWSSTGVLSLGTCRGVLLYFYRSASLSDSNATTYTAAVYNAKAYAGGVAPRYSATDGLTALRAADVASALLADVPAYMTSGSDVAEDLTVCEPFDVPGTRADRMAALLNITDGAYYWESRGPGMPWSVFRSRASLPVVDLPAEDGTRVSCNIAPADISGMCSAVKVIYTETGVRKTYTAYDTDPSHYLVQIGRYQGGAFGPKWGAMLDIGDATLAMAQQAAATYFAYTTHGHSGPAPWTGNIVLTGARPFPAYMTPGSVLRCPTRDYGSVTARARESQHTGATMATFTLDNTATASDMVARSVEGLNRARAFTAARAIKRSIAGTRAIRRQARANAKANAKRRKKKR